MLGNESPLEKKDLANLGPSGRPFAPGTRSGVPTTHPSVSNAVVQIRNNYGGDTVALWAWHNGDLPLWMTFDAIEALRFAHLAAPAWPS